METSAAAPPSASLLRWQCRRGMKELDLVLRRYLDRDYAAATPALQQAFAELLLREDPDIWLWVIGYEAPPASFAAVLHEIRRYA
jgi:antitoxin CptB